VEESLACARHWVRFLSLKNKTENPGVPTLLCVARDRNYHPAMWVALLDVPIYILLMVITLKEYVFHCEQTNSSLSCFWPRCKNTDPCLRSKRELCVCVCVCVRVCVCQAYESIWMGYT
jgi:hypothetical protein